MGWGAELGSQEPSGNKEGGWAWRRGESRVGEILFNLAAEAVRHCMLPHGRLPEHPSNQADLSGVNHFVMTCPADKLPFDGTHAVLRQDWVVEGGVRDRRERVQTGLVDTIKGRAEVGRGRLAGGVRVGDRFTTVPAQKPGDRTPGRPHTRSSTRRFSAIARCPTCQAMCVGHPGGKANHSGSGIVSTSARVYARANFRASTNGVSRDMDCSLQATFPRHFMGDLTVENGHAR